MTSTNKQIIYLNNKSSKVTMLFDENQNLIIEFIILKDKLNITKVMLSINTSIVNNKLLKHDSEIIILVDKKESK